MTEAKKEKASRCRTKLPGILLKLERSRQKKGQKEVCQGICVPSYLSKIEHGTVCPDGEIIAKLFARLAIDYEEAEEKLSFYKKMIDEYFYCQLYALDTTAVYQELKKWEQKLRYSVYAIDWLLIRGFEKEDVMSLLEELEAHMEAEQRAYYQILCASKTDDARERVSLCRTACSALPCSYTLLCLGEAYLWEGNYAAIHAMEQRIVAIAVEEGNTFALADCFFLNGTAYACLNMEEMMMLYYERGIRLIQNTGWQDWLATMYYNMGATYISLKKYELALENLEKANMQGKMSVDILHKKAIAYIRMGDREHAAEFLEKMREELFRGKEPSTVDVLKYEEAKMECEEGFLENPEYLELLEKLISEIKKTRHFGHLYFYREVIVEAYKRQRKYKRALDFEKEISENIVKHGF